VQAVLRAWFAQWGLPAQLRLDNGAPWGGWNDLPPDLALWLLGLGIELHWNAPHYPQGNAVLEQGHGVCQRWAEPERCPDLATLQAHLDWAVTTQRERYPSCAGRRSRREAYPGLADSGRPYDPAQEAQVWDVRRVWTWLGQHVAVRRVGPTGQISLANRTVGVGKAWAQQEVTVRLTVVDAAPVWVIHDRQGHALRQHAAPELAAARIRALDVSRRGRRAKPHVHHGD
jgi:hypothetical protein